MGVRKQEQPNKLERVKSAFISPYDYHIMSHGPGTKDNPNKIPSANNSRIVGCICDENSTDINFMELNKDDPKCCECGFWFELVLKLWIIFNCKYVNKVTKI